MAKNGLPGPALWLSILITLVGATLASLGGWQTFEQTFELLTVESFEVPGAQTRQLPVGEYETYGQVAGVSVFDLDNSIFRDEPVFFVDDITVKNVDTGETLPLQVINPNLTLSRSTNVYAPVASFEVTTEGRYEISIDADEPSLSVVGRSIQSAPDRIIPWAIMLLVGGLLTILGLAMLVSGILRRSRLKKQPGYNPTAPAGYTAPAADASAPQPPTTPGMSPPPTAPPGAPVPPSPGMPGLAPKPPEPNQDPHTPDTNTPWG